MKKVLIYFLVFVFCAAVWYGESRRIISFPDGKHITVWKTYNNNCYIVIGKYYGLLGPSLKHAYIKTLNTSSGVDLIWEKESDTILAQADSGSVLNSSSAIAVKIINYNLNKTLNDTLYTYFDNKLKVRRYKKDVNVVCVPINEMGAF